MPREGFEPSVLGLKVQSIDHCANGAWPVFALAVYSPSFLVPFAGRRAAGQRDRWLATSESNRALPLYQSGPFDRLGRGQQMAEVPTPSASAPFRVQAGGCHPAASPSMCGRRRTRPPAVARSPDFESGTASMTVSSSTDLPPMQASGRWRRMEIPTPSALRRPSAFQAEPAPWPVHPPGEEGGRLERQGVTPASVSNGARRACPVHLPFVPNRGFEPRTSWFWARRLYLRWASSACERLTGFEPATSTVARWRSCLLSYNRMEPSPGADPGGTPIPRASGRRSEGHRSGHWTRTSVRLLQKAGWARAQESRHPVPTRAIRRTKAEPQPCAAAKLPSLDSNQEPLGSEPSAAAG